jgi:hypothetical protein
MRNGRKIAPQASAPPPPHYHDTPIPLPCNASHRTLSPPPTIRPISHGITTFSHRDMATCPPRLCHVTDDSDGPARLAGARAGPRQASCRTRPGDRPAQRARAWRSSRCRNRSVGGTPARPPARPVVAANHPPARAIATVRCNSAVQRCNSAVQQCGAMVQQCRTTVRFGQSPWERHTDDMAWLGPGYGPAQPGPITCSARLP